MIPSLKQMSLQLPILVCISVCIHSLKLTHNQQNNITLSSPIIVTQENNNSIDSNIRNDVSTSINSTGAGIKNGTLSSNVSNNNTSTSNRSEQTNLSTTEQSDAKLRLFEYASSDKQLLKALSPGNTLSYGQLRRVLQFMANDKYYQNKLLKQIKKSPKSAWLEKIPQDQQIKYLKVIVSVRLDKVDDQDVMNDAISEIYNIKEIRPFIKQAAAKDYLQKCINATNKTINCTKNQVSNFSVSGEVIAKVNIEKANTQNEGVQGQNNQQQSSSSSASNRSSKDRSKEQKRQKKQQKRQRKQEKKQRKDEKKQAKDQKKDINKTHLKIQKQREQIKNMQYI